MSMQRKPIPGQVVTTSDLSRGATEVIKVRAYPVTVANGKQVRSGSPRCGDRWRA